MAIFICASNSSTHKKKELINLPDILDVEKSQIRAIAKQCAISLWKISFDEGVRAYVQINNSLYVHPARWKYCLKCGEINKKEAMEKHNCLFDVEFPIIIQTSWYRLKAFFLTNRYKTAMQEIGIDKIPAPTVIVKPKAVTVKGKLPDPISEENQA